MIPVSLVPTSKYDSKCNTSGDEAQTIGDWSIYGCQMLRHQGRQPLLGEEADTKSTVVGSKHHEQ